MENAKVAIYGLGNMGYLVAERISKNFSIKVFDLNMVQVNNACANFSAQQIVEDTNFKDINTVVLCLPTPEASQSVLNQISSKLTAGTVVIETSTINPNDINLEKEILEKHNISLIDASILAGVSQMKAGKATLLLGGEESNIIKVQPVLNAITDKQIYFGPLGSGAAAKVINNAVAHAVMVVVAEAGSLAAASGVSCKKLIDLLSDPEMGLHRPLTHRYAERIAENNYSGGMPLDAALKDSVLATKLAQSLGVPMFAIQGSHTIYEIASAKGYGRDDYAAIAKVWEDWGKPTINNY